MNLDTWSYNPDMCHEYSNEQVTNKSLYDLGNSTLFAP